MSTTAPHESTTVERFTRWVIRRRWRVLAAALALAISAGSGARNLGLSTDYRTFFSEDNPDLLDGFLNTLAIDYIGTGDAVANIELARTALQNAIEADPG